MPPEKSTPCSRVLLFPEPAVDPGIGMVISRLVVEPAVAVVELKSLILAGVPAVWLPTFQENRIAAAVVRLVIELEDDALKANGVYCRVVLAMVP
jgi:hypothetical protein